MSASIISELSRSELSKKYKATGEYSFPAYETIDPEYKKTGEYCKDVAMAAYSTLMRDKTALPADNYNYIQVLRDYGTGSQSMAYYTNRLKDVEPSLTNDSNQRTQTDILDQKRRGDDNINNQIVSLIPNMKSAVMGLMEDYEEDIFINAIDNESGAEEEDAMFSALWDAQNSKFTKRIQEEYGVPIHNEGEIPGDISTEELQVYKDTGGFKTAWAEAMEELVHFTEEFSKWDRVLKRKLISDAIDINFLAARVVHDHISGLEKWEYVDPANFIIQYSQKNNFEDSEYAGFFTLEKLGNLVSKGFSSKQLIEAAKRYEFLFDNPKGVDWPSIDKTMSLSGKIFEFKVPVFHFNWIDVDVKRQSKVTNKYGKTYIYDLEFNEELLPLTDYRKRKGTVSQEELKTRIERAYQCSWVVDSDMIYDYGRTPNQTRNSKRKSKLSFVAWRGVNTNPRMVMGSITESIMPFSDHLMLGWLKYQDALVKAHPGGYKLNIRLLQNLKIGSKQIDPLKAYKMFWDKGVLPYMDVSMGSQYSGGDVTPISRVEGTEGLLMAVFQTEIQFVVQMIERITGISPAALGVAPDSDQPVATTQMTMQGTNNVLKPYFNAVFDIKKGLADETMKRLPILFRSSEDKRKAYSRIAGEQSVEIVRQAERAGAEYGLYSEPRPSGSEKQDLITMIQTAMQVNRDGEFGINLGQGFYIIERIKSGGNFKKLQRQVELMIRKSEQEAFEKKRALITEQNQQQAQIAQAQKQGEMQIKQMDTQSQITIDNNKAKNELQKIRFEKHMEHKGKLIDQRIELMTKMIENRQTQPVA